MVAGKSICISHKATNNYLLEALLRPVTKYLFIQAWAVLSSITKEISFSVSVQGNFIAK